MSDARTVFAGRYLVGDLAARGGTATVHAAVDLLTNQTVALKTLLPAAAQDAAMRARLEREATVLGRLAHPNIVSLHAAGYGDHHEPYLALEWVHGRSLMDVIRESAPLPLSRLLHIALQIARAVRAVHRHGLMHRDLKPHNVMLMQDGDEYGRDVVKLIDFGTVKALPARPIARANTDRLNLTRPGTIVGTPHYMSPEQLFLEEVDGRTDVYAMGVILYEMISGIVPYAADSLVEIMRQHALGERLHIEDAVARTRSTRVHGRRGFAEPGPDGRGELPHALCDLVERCLDPEPDRRPAGADALCRELEALLGVDTRPASTAPSARPSYPDAYSPGGETLVPAPRKLRAA